MPTPIQTKRDVESMLTAAGLRPDKHLGQHFLIDGNLMRKLVASAEIAPGDVVFEVGGGTGGLTDLLAEAATHVVVVEVDHDLAPLLRARFADRPHVHVLHADVLANKSTVAPGVLQALSDAQDVSKAAGSIEPRAVPRILLVANLPYHVATPLLMNLFTATPRVERFVFTIQQEVADRLDAPCGSRDYGPLAIAVQTTCRFTRFAKLPPQAFWPPPNVASAMIRLDRQPHPFEQGEDLDRFIKLLRAAFAHRRKTVRYNLARHLAEPALNKALELIDGDERAERIELEDWVRLGREISSLA